MIRKVEELYMHISLWWYVKWLFFKRVVLPWLTYLFIFAIIFIGGNVAYAWYAVNTRIGINENDKFFKYHVVSKPIYVAYADCMCTINKLSHDINTTDTVMYHIFNCIGIPYQIEVYNSTPEIVTILNQILKR